MELNIFFIYILDTDKVSFTNIDKYTLSLMYTLTYILFYCLLPRNEKHKTCYSMSAVDMLTPIFNTCAAYTEYITYTIAFMMVKE